MDRASEILRAHNRHLMGGLIGGVLLTAALGVLAYHSPDGSLAHTTALIGAFTAWAPFVFAVVRSAPDDDLVRDATAVLKAWAEKREAWAKAVVETVEEDAAEDVRAWSQADGELRRMAERARGSAQRAE